MTWTTRISNILVALAAILAPTSGAAHAQPCPAREQVVERLERDFGERPRAVGLVGPHGLLEVFVSPRGSWTLLFTTIDGLSCVLATGEEWQDLPRIPDGPAAGGGLVAWLEARQGSPMNERPSSQNESRE